MNAKDIIIDFLNYAFLIAIIIFFMVFFIVGDRFETFTDTLRSLTPLASFTAVLIIYYKYRKRQTKKRNQNNENEDYQNEVIVYLERKDKLKDLAVIIFIAVINIIIPLIMSTFFVDDFVQVLNLFIAMLLWSLFLLREDKFNKSISITLKKILNDEIVIFLYPIIFYTLAYTTGKTPDATDTFQSLIPLLVMYPWHYLLFQKKNLRM